MELNPWKKVELVKAYKKFFDSEDGKLVLADLVRECGMFRDSFRGDTNDMLINEGKRNVLLYILSNTNVDLNTLLKMVSRQSQGEE